MKSFFIVPIHNKDYLIADVINGIIDSCKGDLHIICILDGCTDLSEIAVVKPLKRIAGKYTILRADDVHEITCLNQGLTQVKLMNPNDDDLVFTIQDDVVLQEEDIDGKFRNLFEHHSQLGYVSMRLGSTLVYQPDSIGETNHVESEFGHWKQLGMSHFSMAKHGTFVPTQIAIRSPTCVQWKRYKEVGFYDATLAPCGYDCHDFSIRMIEHGYRNGVYAMKYRSDVSWGGMRTPNPSEINKKHGEIYEWNRRYLAIKHRSFLLKNAE